VRILGAGLVAPVVVNLYLSEAAIPMVLPYAHVNDIDMTLYYEVEGEGEPLILVHGLLGSAADWRRFVPLLAGA